MFLMRNCEETLRCAYAVCLSNLPRKKLGVALDLGPPNRLQVLDPPLLQYRYL